MHGHSLTGTSILVALIAMHRAASHKEQQKWHCRRALQQNLDRSRSGYRRKHDGAAPGVRRFHVKLRHGVFAVVLLFCWAAAARADDSGTVITIKGGKFVPSEVTVPANTRVKLIVRNQDPSMSEFESVDLHREKTVTPGNQILVFVGPLSAGSYEFFDDFHPQDRGHLIAK